jgi:hypothetical protein
MCVFCVCDFCVWFVCVLCVCTLSVCLVCVPCVCALCSLCALCVHPCVRAWRDFLLGDSAWFACTRWCVRMPRHIRCLRQATRPQTSLPISRVSSPLRPSCALVSLSVQIRDTGKSWAIRCSNASRTMHCRSNKIHPTRRTHPTEAGFTLKAKQQPSSNRSPGSSESCTPPRPRSCSCVPKLHWLGPAQQAQTSCLTR